MIVTRAVQHDFTPAELDSAAASAAMIEQIFGFCISLEGQDRHDLYKMGPKSYGFVTQLVQIAQAHIHLVPRGVDVDDLEARLKTREILEHYVNHLQPLIARMQHSIMLLGAEILHDSLKLYKTLKVNGDEEGLHELLKEIGKRFYTKKKKRKETLPRPDRESAEAVSALSTPKRKRTDTRPEVAAKASEAPPSDSQNRPEKTAPSSPQAPGPENIPRCNADRTTSYPSHVIGCREGEETACGGNWRLHEHEHGSPNAVRGTGTTS